jgi:hypothetical protein
MEPGAILRDAAQERARQDEDSANIYAILSILVHLSAMDSGSQGLPG